MKAIWIGLVDVIPCGETSPLSPGAKGAYIYALAPAEDYSEYKSVVETALNQLGLHATEFDDVELFSHRVEKEVLADDLYSLATEAA